MVSIDVVGQVGSAPQDNPTAAALVVFGSGLAVGLALPPTEKERQGAEVVRRQVVEPLKGQATQAGKGVAGELQAGAPPARYGSGHRSGASPPGGGE